MTNLSDRCYIGPAQSIALFTPLLAPLSTNPHAVLLLLFQNAIPRSGSPGQTLHHGR